MRWEYNPNDWPWTILDKTSAEVKGNILKEGLFPPVCISVYKHEAEVRSESKGENILVGPAVHHDENHYPGPGPNYK